MYNESDAVKYDLTYPVFSGDHNASQINLYNRNLIERVVNKSARSLYKDAVKQYMILIKHNSFTPFEVKNNFNIMFMNNSIVSIFWDFYISRGAQGIIMRRVSQNWNMKKAGLLTLGEIFRPDRDWKNHLLTLLKKEIGCFESEMCTKCFDGWQNVIYSSVEKSRFYITDSGLVIYCPQGSVASDVWGIPSFLVSFCDLDGMLDKKFVQSLQ
jgi:hypothetical protein